MTIKAQLQKFHKEHQISSPHGRPVNSDDGITICSCGAQWHTFYTDKGLQWLALNEKCAQHDADQAALPANYYLDQEGNVFYEPPIA